AASSFAKPSAGTASTRRRALSGSAIASPSSSPRSSTSWTCSPAAIGSASLTSRPPPATNFAAGGGNGSVFIASGARTSWVRARRRRGRPEREPEPERALERQRAQERQREPERQLEPAHRTCRTRATMRARTRGASLLALARAGDPVLVEPIDQRAARDAEQL